MRIAAPPWLKEALEITQSNSRRRSKKIGIYFEDEFAPSWAKIQIDDNASWINSRTRMGLYNDHLIDTLELALSVASKLGAPWVFYGFPLQFSEVTGAELAVALQKAADLAEAEKEGSPNWLALVCYTNWVQACWMQTEGVPLQVVAEQMFWPGPRPENLNSFCGIVNTRLVVEKLKSRLKLEATDDATNWSR